MDNIKKKMHLKKALLAGTVIVLLFAAVSTATIVAQENEEEKRAEKVKPEIEGSANIGEVIKKFIEENRQVTFSGASAIAQKELAESKIVKGNFGIVQGYLVYTFLGVDSEEQQKYKVIVDAGDAQILYKSDPIPMKQFKSDAVDLSAELELYQTAVIAEKEIENGVIQMGMLRVEDDKAVYVFLVTDIEQGTKYIVTIDANNGEVLDVSEGKAMKSLGFHGKHHGYKHKAYSDKDRDGSEDTSSTGDKV